MHSCIRPYRCRKEMLMKRILALILVLSTLLLTLSGCSVLETLFKRDTHTPSLGEAVKNPPAFGNIDNAKINSLDKLNYYSAICHLSWTPMPISAEIDLDRSYSLLVEHADDIPLDTNDGSDTSDATDGNTTDNIRYYEIMPDDPFIFDSISMFQIELTDPDGFLASKLGLGIVDVVISKDCIWSDSLITFRNGDKFFSCLSNGWSYDRQTGNTYWDFSTHKYVDGFYIVKNLEQENYSFNIFMDSEGQAISFECTLSENGGDRVDQNVKIASSTVFSTSGGRFTISELEAYFKNKEENEDSYHNDENDTGIDESTDESITEDV